MNGSGAVRVQLLPDDLRGGRVEPEWPAAHRAQLCETAANALENRRPAVSTRRRGARGTGPRLTARSSAPLGLLSLSQGNVSAPRHARCGSRGPVFVWDVGRNPYIFALYRSS